MTLQKSLENQRRIFDTSGSKKLSELAQKVLPEGVGSPVRGPRFFKPYPPYMKSGRGSKIYDVDGNEYLDYVMAYGPLILGHAHPKIVNAIIESAKQGTMLNSAQEIEYEVARKVGSFVPNAELVRFTSTGTEATMHAIRLARAYTERKKILKFEGHFHGNHDYVLVNIHPALASMGTRRAPVRIPESSGIPEETVQNTIISPWNDINVLERIVKNHKNEIATIILEPIMANSGHIAPEEGYLQQVREIATANDIVLIFDEVITGFRLALGGAQEYFGVDADLITMAKALGGGIPIGAFAGKKEIMSLLTAEGRVWHSGTYNGTKLCLDVANAVLDELSEKRNAFYKDLFLSGGRLIEGIRHAIRDNKTDAIVQGVGPMFQLYFTKLEAIKDWRDFERGVDSTAYGQFAQELLQRGIYISPAAFEHWFISSVHSADDIDAAITKVDEVFRAIKTT